MVAPPEATRRALPITTTIQGLSSEVIVGPANGLDHTCAVSLDNLISIPVTALGRILGFLNAEQEAELARALIVAFDLDVPILG